MTDLRTIERKSIRAFVQRAADDGYLSGRVLDYGCGKQPYRDIVEATGGEYVGYDSPQYGGSVVTEEIGDDRVGRFDWQAILCTQVLQYVHHVAVMLRGFKTDLQEEHGHLVLTYPTNWPEVEPEDLHRFTKAGMERLLVEVGFEIVLHERRAWITADLGNGRSNGEFALGYGVIARA